MKIFTTGLLSSLIVLSNVGHAITTQVPVSFNTNQDQVGQTAQTIQGNPDIWLTLIQLANKYLRIVFAVILLGVLVIIGAKLMSGKRENLKGLISVVIAILIAIFSFTIVRLVVNLF